jgi:hypothetical protein
MGMRKYRSRTFPMKAQSIEYRATAWNSKCTRCTHAERAVFERKVGVWMKSQRTPPENAVSATELG